jgi:hypothetical protein
MKSICRFVLVCSLLGAVASAGEAPSGLDPFGGSGFDLPGLDALAPPEPAEEAAPTVPTTPEEPEMDIVEAAGTVTDPTAFIYLSKEFVFNVLVLANSMFVPGVQFDASQLTTIEVPPADAEGDVQTSWLGDSTAGGRRTLEGAEFLSEQGGGAGGAEEEGDHNAWLDAVSVAGNDELAKILELVQDLPDWNTVGRFPLPTTEKKKIDGAISQIYALTFAQVTAQRQQYASPYGSSYGSDPYAPTRPGPQYPTATPGVTAPGAYPGAPGAPGTVPMAPQGPPPVDPVAMGEWYYYYQQSLAWERYVSEEVLMLTSSEQEENYTLGAALQPNEMFFTPPNPDGTPRMIHFDYLESGVTQLLSAVKPRSMGSALDHMSRVMSEKAVERAKEDSDRGRAFVIDPVDSLNARKERRFRYREWLDDQATEVAKMAEDFSRRVQGDQFVIEDVMYIVTRDKELNSVPYGARNIVTERLTPYDLLEEDGTLKRPIEEVVHESP